MVPFRERQMVVGGMLVMAGRLSCWTEMDIFHFHYQSPPMSLMRFPAMMVPALSLELIVATVTGEVFKVPESAELTTEGTRLAVELATETLTVGVGPWSKT